MTKIVKKQGTEMVKHLRPFDHKLSGGKQMAKSANITQEYLKSILNYDPLTGEFTHKSRGNSAWDARWADKKAGTLDAKGRCQLWISGSGYRAHRIAWLYMTGEFPKSEIDHINCDPLDNRWDNLRLANRSQQNQNKRPLRAWPPKGVYWHEQSKMWRAKIGKIGRHLGLFDCPAAASIAYQLAAIKSHGQFERSF
jgi:hypothetical protein